MATGLRIYRHNDLYFSFRDRNHFQPHPTGLGVAFAAEIPQDSLEFETYVVSKRKMLDELLDGSSVKDLIISKNPPMAKTWRGFTDKKIAWTYEIDLDNYIFLTDGEPLFDLRNMPPRNRFGFYIGYDLYGRRSFTHNTPQEHRYKLPPSSPVESNILDIYKSYQARCVDTLDVLGVPLEMRMIEQTRVKIMQVFIAASMASLSNRNGLGINAVLSNTLPTNVIARLRIICTTFAGPFMFSDAMKSLFSSEYRYEYLEPWRWIVKERFCMLAVPRLDDESTLQAAVVQLVQNITRYFEAKECAIGTVFYGAILSLYDVSIVRFTVAERMGQQIKFHLEHTPSLQFLPVDHANVSYTTGIEALARLGQVVFDLTTRENIINKNAVYHKSASSDSHIMLLPQEICLNIAQHLSPMALEVFATISPSCAHAAADLLIQAYFGENLAYPRRSSSREGNWYRILPVRGPGILLPTMLESSEDSYDFSGFLKLERGVCRRNIGTKDVYVEDIYFCTFFAVDEEGVVVRFMLTFVGPGVEGITRELQGEEIHEDYRQMDVVYGVGPNWCKSLYD